VPFCSIRHEKAELGTKSVENPWSFCWPDVLHFVARVRIPECRGHG
jgi:hypothetical protein